MNRKFSSSGGYGSYGGYSGSTSGRGSYYGTLYLPRLRGGSGSLTSGSGRKPRAGSTIEFQVGQQLIVEGGF